MAVLFSKKTKNLPSPKPKPNRSEWCIFAWFSQLWFVVMDNFTSLTRSNDDKLYETPIINSHNFIFLQFPPPKKTPQNWSEQCEVINIHSMTCANTNNWDTIYFQLKNNPSQFQQNNHSIYHQLVPFCLKMNVLLHQYWTVKKSNSISTVRETQQIYQKPTATGWPNHSIQSVVNRQ